MKMGQGSAREGEAAGSERVGAALSRAWALRRTHWRAYERAAFLAVECDEYISIARGDPRDGLVVDARR